METKIDTEQFVADMEGARKDLLWTWCENTINVMKAMLKYFETSVKLSEREYDAAFAISPEDWAEVRETILSAMKRKLEIEVEQLERLRGNVKELEKSKAVVLQTFKCAGKSTKSDIAN